MESLHTIVYMYGYIRPTSIILVLDLFDILTKIVQSGGGAGVAAERPRTDLTEASNQTPTGRNG